jgi:hypothetical protein
MDAVHVILASQRGYFTFRMVKMMRESQRPQILAQACD